MLNHSLEAFNIRPAHTQLDQYVLFYNLVFPKQNMFVEHYTLMPDACSTLSLAYDGKDILADKRMPLKEVDKTLSNSLCCAFESAKHIAELFSKCDEILYHYMDNCVVSDALLAATKAVSDNQGQMLVAELAKKVGYSERQLNRLFFMQIGMNIKSYTRLVRFNNVLRHLLYCHQGGDNL